MRKGGGFLDLDDGVDEGGSGRSVESEVLARAFGLYAPQRIGRHWHLAQRVTLDARLIPLPPPSLLRFDRRSCRAKNRP